MRTVLFGMVLFFGLMGSHQVLAQPVWGNGIVTHKPWKDRQFRIEIDGIQYMLMPDSRVYKRYQRSPGVYDEKPLSIHHIRKGQSILMWVLGHNIHQLVVLQ